MKIFLQDKPDPERVCVCVRARRVELSDAVENVDMSLEELQHLLLRSHQQNTTEPGSSSGIDVCTYIERG